ncbi:transmembrane protein 135 [Eupeodes corollae]|uniref:transmembrane protein 135 n=1 Tax=Eupeodes corollae TaxID=290404 RepID=UPI002492E63C|nr:transmembrane protein 135 [Eupeodes corollae]
MVSLSKLLNQGLRDAKCYEVFHPGKTCSEFHFGKSRSLLIKCVKFFFPIATVPLILKGKNLRKKHVREAFEYYMELILTGFLISQQVPMAWCLVRRLSGKFTECNIVYLPMTLPTWTIFFISPRVARLFAASIFQVTFEAAIRNSKNKICKTFCNSKTIQALLFMTCSAFVLHTIQNYNVKAFWVVKSIPRPIESDIDAKCSHNGECSKFWLNDLAKNILIGLSIDVFKTFVGSITKTNSLFNAFGNKLVHLNFPTTFFLSSYSCIYKMTSCLLNQKSDMNGELKHIIAAFLGGISFFTLPKLTILCYIISISIEISWHLFERKKFKNNLKYLELLKRIPFHRIYTCLSVGYLVQMYVFHPEALSQLGLAMVSAFTGDQAPEMKAVFHNYIKTIKHNK